MEHTIDKRRCLDLLKRSSTRLMTKVRTVSTRKGSIVFSASQRKISYHLYSESTIVIMFDEVLSSFIDPERPTEEEFVMFKLQYGVDWIVEPVK